MAKKPLNPVALRHLIADRSIAFGIPAYNEGDGIVPGLNWLWKGIESIDLTDSPIVLSDSYDDESLSSSEPALKWAQRVSANLQVHTAARRRTLKEALNVIFDSAESDVLILLNADVLLPTSSLMALIQCLFHSPHPVAAIGSTLPDPAYSEFSRRAGAWQLRAVTRAASLMPRTIGPTSLRHEGAFWGVWRSFYSSYRFPIGHGSIADDVELVGALMAGNYPCRSVPEAFVYKVPPSSTEDLCSGVVRSQRALSGHKRGSNEFVAALLETARDPIGALLYARARIWCYRNRKVLTEDAAEEWRVLQTTKRRSRDS